MDESPASSSWTWLIQLDRLDSHLVKMSCVPADLQTMLKIGSPQDSTHVKERMTASKRAEHWEDFRHSCAASISQKPAQPARLFAWTSASF